MKHDEVMGYGLMSSLAMRVEMRLINMRLIKMRLINTLFNRDKTLDYNK